MSLIVGFAVTLRGLLQSDVLHSRRDCPVVKHSRELSALHEDDHRLGLMRPCRRCA